MGDLMVCLKSKRGVLAGRLGRLERRPAHLEAVVSIPGQGSYRGCGFGPGRGVYGR